MTEDSTPTLVWSGEAMHSRKGALHETLFVYGRAIEEHLSLGFPPHFMVVGLGLGYIEWTILAKCRLHGVTPCIWSFEKDGRIKDAFLETLEGAGPRWKAESFHSARSSVEAALGAPGLSDLGRSYLKNGNWVIQTDVKCFLSESQSEVPISQFSGIFYDPFSVKVDPELWAEEFLGRFLRRFAAPSCVFASYASRGALKRVLKRQGFLSLERTGFAGKRESTLAVRNPNQNLT